MEICSSTASKRAKLSSSSGLESGSYINPKPNKGKLQCDIQRQLDKEKKLNLINYRIKRLMLGNSALREKVIYVVEQASRRIC
jgi:hypothetical protein